MIKYPLPFGKSYLYIPYGPIIKREELSDKFFVALKSKLVDLAKEENSVFVRLDFNPPLPNDLLSPFFTKAPFYTYRSAYFQPRREWLLGLDKPLEELVKSMHKKTRYSLRVAEKEGVISEIIVRDFEEYFGTFYKLMTETAARDKFSLHPRDYYLAVFRSLSAIPKSYLSIAKYQDQVLVVNLMVVFGGIANHVFGGSSNTWRNLCPSYSAQLAAIRYAKQIGCRDYNFGGIASEDASLGWEGITRFKKRFGGRELKHSDFFDLIQNPLWYQLYKFRKSILGHILSAR